MEATHNGRVYQLTENTKAEHTSLRADLIKRGFDGTVWIGESRPVGRQRRTYCALFYRCAKTQTFVFIIAAP